MTVLTIKDNLKQSWRPLLINGAILLVAVSIFFGLAEEVLEKEAFAWDSWIASGLHSLSAPLLDTLMTAITWTGYQIAVPLALLVVTWLWSQRAYRRATFMGIAVAGAGLLSLWLKGIFQRVRPTLFTPLQIETSYSFPSGHTLMAVGVYGFVAMLLWRSQRRGWAVLVGLWPFCANA
jgi:undecaprenyl-diphosphatase